MENKYQIHIENIYRFKIPQLIEDLFYENRSGITLINKIQ